MNRNVSSGRRVAERKYNTERKEYVRKECATEEVEEEEEEKKKRKKKKKKKGKKKEEKIEKINVEA
jgi:hypothetical protein